MELAILIVSVCMLVLTYLFTYFMCLGFLSVCMSAYHIMPGAVRGQNI